MRTTTLILTGLVLGTATALTGCGVGEASVADQATARAEMPVPVEVAQPYRTDLYASYVATATLGSDDDAPAVARVAGDVVELLVEEGDRVVEGQVLARLDGERLRLEMLAAKASLEQARKEYERNRDLHKRGLISASMFDKLQYDLEALKATYQLKRLDYEYSKIRAPIAGVVASRDIRPGQNVRPDDVAFRITDTAELVAYLSIPQSEISKFSAGHKALIEVAAMPDERFPATLARISPTIDVRNGTFRATAIIDNAQGKLAPGMFGKFTIAYEAHPNALVIPETALLNDEDTAVVYVVDSGAVERRAVRTGISSGGRVEILGGLDETEVIVVVGQSALRDGSKVLASNTGNDLYAG